MTSYYDTLYTEFVKEWVYIYTKLDEVLLVSDTGFRIDRAKRHSSWRPEAAAPYRER